MMERAWHNGKDAHVSLALFLLFVWANVRLLEWDQFDTDHIEIVRLKSDYDVTSSLILDQPLVFRGKGKAALHEGVSHHRFVLLPVVLIQRYPFLVKNHHRSAAFAYSSRK